MAVKTTPEAPKTVPQKILDGDLGKTTKERLGKGAVLFQVEYGRDADISDVTLTDEGKFKKKAP